MNEDTFNMEVRKFLKVVGVTSQREIEKAVRDAIARGKIKGAGKLKIEMGLSMSEIGLSQDIKGEIDLG